MNIDENKMAEAVKNTMARELGVPADKIKMVHTDDPREIIRQIERSEGVSTHNFMSFTHWMFNVLRDAAIVALILQLLTS